MHRPRFNMAYALYAAAILGVLLFGTLGTYILGKETGNFNIEINSPLKALYFTIVTLSTVGYGDIYPVSTAGVIFVIALIISGLSIFLGAVTLVSGDFLNSRIEKMSGTISSIERRLLRGHIVLIGYDMTNAYLAEKLMKEGKKFILISSDKIVVDKLRAAGIQAYVADVTLKSDMQRFALDKAKYIVIDMRDSSKTVYVFLVVKKLSEKAKIFAVASNSEAESHLGDLGVEDIINPAKIAAAALDAKVK